jgi:hypothetical protein
MTEMYSNKIFVEFPVRQLKVPMTKEAGLQSLGISTVPVNNMK